MAFGFNNNDLDPALSPWGTNSLSASRADPLGQRVTAMDRVGVRRMALIIERFMGDRLSEYHFDINDEQTRRTLTSEIEEFMIQLRDERTALYDFRVVCDETNNTPEDMDNGQLNLDVMFQPTRAVEFITLNASLVPQPNNTEREVEFKSDADAYRHRLGMECDSE